MTKKKYLELVISRCGECPYARFPDAPELNDSLTCGKDGHYVNWFIKDSEEILFKKCPLRDAKLEDIL